jgi:SAM-dependent methyltransferase
MSELYRVLKPGGWGVFQVPIDYNREKTYEDFSITDPLEREKAFGQIDHVRWYGRDYADRLRAAGFNVKADDFVLSFSDEEIFKYGFMKSELIYYCTKL